MATKAFAPGKLVLTGAYVVLEGAPAVAVAVSRGAIADAARVAASPTPEVCAALGDGPAPEVDASSMFEGGRKLGLGASAAILVASIAAREGDAVELASDRVRDAIFERARAAHARAQSGGSGVDVATSVHGGAIVYRVGHPVVRVRLPDGLTVEVLACPNSARTTDLRAAVDRLAKRAPEAYRSRMQFLAGVAARAEDAVLAGDATGFVDALRETARGLAALGAAADVEIVPSGFDELEALAAEDGAAFSVSGAGGGDVAVHVGPRAPTRRFLERARSLGLTSVPLSFDSEGVRRTR